MRIATAAAVILVTLAVAPASDAYICTGPSGCEFWDGNYHEYILYNVDTYKVDVLIAPAASPFVLSDVTYIRKAIDGWENGIMAMGPPWLTSKFQMNTYTLGVDVPSTDALTDPEILVITSEHDPVLLFGIGLQTPLGICRATGPSHVHEGGGARFMAVQAQCTQGGLTCIALNTNFLFGGAYQLYDLVAHEVGHCLGVGHVGDAGDFDAKTVPMQDIMSYQQTPGQVHCVSSLNMLAIQAVYANPSVLNQAGYLAPGSYVQQAPTAYTRWACPNL